MIQKKRRLWNLARAERGRREMMKGICVEHLERLCLNKMCSRNDHKNRCIRLSWESGAQTPKQQWMSSSWATLKCPALFKWLLHTQEGRKRDKGKQWKVLELWTCFIFSKDSLWSIKQFEFLDVCSELTKKSSPRTRGVCDFFHLLCTVNSEKDAPLLTKYLYMWTFDFCLFQRKRKKERTKVMFLWFWRHARVLCGPVLCNHQYHNLNVVSLCCYSCHPCFLLYYSISEWCQVLYMVWIYVCKEEMWESVQEDALFLLWNILCLLVSKQELCLILLLWLNACI